MATQKQATKQDEGSFPVGGSKAGSPTNGPTRPEAITGLVRAYIAAEDADGSRAGMMAALDRVQRIVRNRLPDIDDRVVKERARQAAKKSS